MPLPANWNSSLAFCAACTAVGLPYWSLPYRELGLPHALIAPGLLVVFAAALLLCVGGSASIGRATLIAAVSVPAAVAARVVVEGLRDPTSHNLWPIELAIALFVGIACALPGGLSGGLLRVLRKRRSGGGDS